MVRFEYCIVEHKIGNRLISCEFEIAYDGYDWDIDQKSVELAIITEDDEFIFEMHSIRDPIINELIEAHRHDISNVAHDKWIS